MSGGPPGGFDDEPKTASDYQFGGSAGLARSAAGWSGQRTGQTKPGQFLAGVSTIFPFVHENPVTCELNPVCIHFKY
jgi:hypothetical protein